MHVGKWGEREGDRVIGSAIHQQRTTRRASHVPHFFFLGSLFVESAMATPLLARERRALRSHSRFVCSRERIDFTRCVRRTRVLLGNLPALKAGGSRLRACYGWVS